MCVYIYIWSILTKTFTYIYMIHININHVRICIYLPGIYIYEYKEIIRLLYILWQFQSVPILCFGQGSRVASKRRSDWRWGFSSLYRRLTNSVGAFLKIKFSWTRCRSFFFRGPTCLWRRARRLPRVVFPNSLLLLPSLSSSSSARQLSCQLRSSRLMTQNASFYWKPAHN